MRYINHSCLVIKLNSMAKTYCYIYKYSERVHFHNKICKFKDTACHISTCRVCATRQRFLKSKFNLYLTGVSHIRIGLCAIHIKPCPDPTPNLSSLSLNRPSSNVPEECYYSDMGDILHTPRHLTSRVEQEILPDTKLNI